MPENDSTGGKVKQKGLSKKGDRYLRSLLVNGAMAVVQQAQKRPEQNPWVTKLLARMTAKQAPILIANKTARIAWATMVHGSLRHGFEPLFLIRTHLANHIRASSREEWLHQQARHMALMSQVKHNARDYPSPRARA